MENCGASQQIENYVELSDHLKIDLQKPLKESNQISNPIEKLGQKTLIDTMKIVDDFVKNDAN